MRKCILIRTNLEYEVVELPDDNTFNDEVYKLLGCSCWEGVPGLFGTYLMVDESGKIKNPPKEVNSLANCITNLFFNSNDLLVGNVLVSTIGMNELGESDLVSLSEFKIKHLLVWLKSSKKICLRYLEDKKCN